MLFDLVKDQEKLILNLRNKVDVNDKHYYAFLSSFNALDNNNELQEYYIKTINDDGDGGYYLLRLYAILQGLFVSIDSLYDLAFSITNSKNFININQNKELKELKYIRNDVVGHPSNRVYNDRKIGYCIYSKDDVFKTTFTYRTVVDNEVFSKTIKIDDLLKSYYLESNDILKKLDSVRTCFVDDKLMSLVTNLYTYYQNKLEIRDVLSKLSNEYKSVYKSNNDRFIYRVSLIYKLKAINSDDDLFNELIDYSIGYQVIKIYEIISELKGIDNKVLDIPRKLPKYIISMFRMFNKSEDLSKCAIYLCDTTHPLFLSSLKQCVAYAKKSYAKYCIMFLDLLNNAYLKGDVDLVYCYAVSLKKYKRM